jgi:phosphohistidine phosphatase
LTNSTTLRQLYLWRHAKSDWNNLFLADHDRPLAPRGKTAAKDMANWMLDHSLRPELVLCSSAKRTQQTLKRLNKRMALKVEILPELYHAEPERILELIGKVNKRVHNLMVIGHNPGFEELVMQLTDAASHSARLTEKIMPTGALAQFSWQGSWSKQLEANVQLEQIICPRTLNQATQTAE